MQKADVKQKPFYSFWIACCLFIFPSLLFSGTLQFHPAFSTHMVLQRDMPVHVFGSGIPETQVTVEFSGQTQTATVEANGKWIVTLGPLKASAEPAVLTATSGSEQISCKDVLVGDVWFCSGQSNMERPFKTYSQLKDTVASLEKPLVRLYHTAMVASETPLELPPEPVKKAQGTVNSWQLCQAAALSDFSPIAYFFAAKVSDELNVPVGVMVCAWGSTSAEAWTPKEVIDSLKLDYKIATNPNSPEQQNRPGVCYNSMINPFLQVDFKGFLWYQGESNSQWADKYKIIFPAMINCWRERFHAEDRPFYFVQIAPYKTLPWDISGEAWAWLRDSQIETLKLVPKTGMTVITDLGEYEDIHPQNKKPAGERLALFALRDAGLPVQPQSPMFKSMKIDGNRCTIEFQNAGSGLETRRVVMNNQKDQPVQKDPQAYVVEADQLQGFTICGPDKKFVAAQASIVGDTVDVWNDSIPAPVAVRYAWTNFPLCNLFSKDGLPVCPFRTDNFPVPQLKADKKK